SRAVLEYMRPAVEQGTAPAACSDVLLPWWRDTLRVVVGSSIDPNDKLSERKGVTAGQDIPYTLQFENLSTALFPSHHVRVVDNLDLNRLDPATIRVGAITVGDSSFLVGDPWLSVSPSVDILLRATIGVRAQVWVDRTFGQIIWDFVSINPNGSEAPSD